MRQNDFLSPICNVYQNIQCASESLAKFDNIIYFYEVVLKQLSSIMFSKYRLSGQGEERITKIISEEFSKPSLGSWYRLLRESLIFLKEDEEEYYKIIFDKRIAEKKVVFAYNNMYQAVHLKLSAKSSISLDNFFEMFVSFRNKMTLAHGAPNQDAKEFFAIILFDCIDELFQILEAIIQNKLVVINKVLVSENKVDVKNIGILYTGSNKQGFEIQTSIVDNLEQNQLFIYDNGIGFLNIHPFLRIKGQNFFFMNGINGKKIEYLSYSTGDRFFEDIETEDLEKFFKVDTLTVSFYEQKIQTQISPTGVIHNLPRIDFDYFGRQKDKKNLLSTLEQGRHSIIALDGIGGVGKTALTLKIAEDLSNLSTDDKLRFSYIIWVSAKQTRLTLQGIEKVEASFGLLDDLLNQIAHVSGFDYLVKESLDVKKEQIIEVLSMDRFLLIIDNFETVKQPKEIWDFLRDMLPLPSMSIITSRHLFAEVGRLIEIRRMEDEDAKELILGEASRLGIKMLMDAAEDEIERIIKYTGGIPLAMKQILGHMALGKSLAKSLSELLNSSEENILDFCFNESYQIMDSDTKELFLTIAKIDKPIRRDGLEIVANLKGANFDEGIAKLIKMSLIDFTSLEDGTHIYNMLPLTEEFALRRLMIEPKFSESIEKRLIEFEELHSLNFVLPNTMLELTSIEKMIQAAMTFASRRDYEKADNWFSKALELKQNDTYVLFNKAQYEQYYKLDYNAAKETYSKLVITDKTDYLNWFHWGMIEKSQENYVEAIKKFDNALKLNPAHVMSYHGKGDCLLKMGIIKKNILKQKGEKDKSIARELKAEANSYFSDAITYLKNGFFVEPKNQTDFHHNTVNHHTLSVAYTRTGQMDLALSECELGLKIEPFNKKLKELRISIIAWKQNDQS